MQQTQQPQHAGASRPGSGYSGPRRSGGYANPAKDRTITRLAVLKAAAQFGASRPDLKSADVLRIAASWEAWVNRN